MRVDIFLDLKHQDVDVPLDIPKVDFKGLLDSKQHSDVTVICQDIQIPCHRLILSHSSEVFEAMLYTHDTTERREGKVFINDMDPEVLKLMISFMYTNQLEDTLSVDGLILLLEAADRYQIR